MKCFIDKVVTNLDVTSEIKTLIPDAGLRRRMSSVLKSAVTTAVECVEGIEGIDRLDAIITATGLGCLADSERFLRNIIVDNEQLLNPTPFIQSTFNTVGGQIAILRHKNCYNVTYVNRDHSFEDALLDALMHIADNESHRVLVGAFDEQTPTQYKIMERMGFWRKSICQEGAVFTTLTAQSSECSLAELSRLDYLSQPLTEKACMTKYADDDNAVLLTNVPEDTGLFPLVSAQLFANGVRKITNGAKQVIIYNGHGNNRPTIMVLKCIGR